MSIRAIDLGRRFGGDILLDRIRATSDPLRRHLLLDQTTTRPRGLGTGSRRSLHRDPDTALINRATTTTGLRSMADLRSGQACRSYSTEGTHSLLHAPIVTRFVKVRSTPSTKRITLDTPGKVVTLLRMGMGIGMAMATNTTDGVIPRPPQGTPRRAVQGTRQSIIMEQMLLPSLDLINRLTGARTTVNIPIR